MSETGKGTGAADGKGTGGASAGGPGPHPEGAPDPSELSRQMAERMAEIAEQSRRLVADFLSRQGSGGSGEDGIGMADPVAIGTAFLEMTARLMSGPARLAGAQAALGDDYLRPGAGAPT